MKGVSNLYNNNSVMLIEGVGKGWGRGAGIFVQFAFAFQVFE